jgi:hypothetical protein
MPIEANVVPSSPDDVTAAPIVCLKGRPPARPPPHHVAHPPARQLRQRLRAAELGEVRAGFPFGPEARVAFCRVEHERHIYTIHAKAFRAWFASRAESVAVLRGTMAWDH